MEIYLDNSATTKPFDSVVSLMSKIYTECYGNPSSRHNKGLEADNYIRYAKEIIAKSLKVSEKEILFTSGGTESDNTALIGIARAAKRRGNHIITSSIEHPAILETCKYLESEGYRVTYLPVSKDGVVNVEDVKKALCEDTILVSIMYVNNEIGSVMPICEIGKIIKEYNDKIIFHTDAVQAYGKYKINPKKLNVDLMSVSAHKIHGPKGVGFLYIKDGTRILPYIYGGGQQLGLRSGTENVPGIAGMAKAVEEIYSDFDNDIELLYELRNRLVDGLLSIDEVMINGSKDNVAPHIVSLSVKNVRAEVLLHALEEKGIYVSSGSACASNKNTTSDTLQAIGLPKEYMDSTIRLSMSVFTTKEEIDEVVEAVKEAVPELRKYVRR